jgi:hypothetical protein
MRGSVYFVNLEPRSGSEQRGTRPCVVVSTDAFNQTAAWQSISIVPITSAKRWLQPSESGSLYPRPASTFPPSALSCTGYGERQRTDPPSPRL